MKSILVISNTYYQLITAIRLKETCWSNERVDIAISDQSNNSKKIVENLKKLNIFENVLWIQTKRLCQDRKSLYLKVKRWEYVIFGISYNKITSNIYDEMVYYNPDVFVYGIFSKLIKNNKYLICSRYEEGILSYSDSAYLNNGRLRYANIIRKKIYRQILEEKTKNFYCFYPKNYYGKHNVIQIPKIDNYKSMGKKLIDIFNIDMDMLRINEKYIFFTSVYDFEGGNPIGEYELVLKIAEIVGKDNFIIKTHPRDIRMVYIDSGLTVYKNAYIPWEAIQLNNDFSQKVLLTVNSSSILGANMMIKNKAKSMFMYECCDYKKNMAAVSTIQNIERLLNNTLYDMPDIIKISSIDEFKEYISRNRNLISNEQ